MDCYEIVSLLNFFRPSLRSNLIAIDLMEESRDSTFHFDFDSSFFHVEIHKIRIEI